MPTARDIENSNFLARDGADTGSANVLPIFPPADTYRRMQEGNEKEKEKERQSQYRSRISAMEATKDATRAAESRGTAEYQTMSNVSIYRF